MRIGIDLLWVRPGICGGTESYTRNLLDGLAQYGADKEYILFVTQDNADSFKKYESYECMTLVTCPTKYEKQSKRILWENLHLAGLAKKQEVDVMFIPVYSKPFTWGSRVPYITVIHDLQGLHYPEYFSTMRLRFFKWCWWYTCKTSRKIVVLSDYGKADLLKYCPFAKERVVRIYNPIVATEGVAQDEEVLRRFNIESGAFFYCVSALLPHKNLETILKVMQGWKGNEKLVLSGVGNQKEELSAQIEALGLQERLVLTGFVSDEERDCLYDHCKLFLFPSVFEGFGMPPIEAMRKGKRVVMTDKTCLGEVTCNEAVYVENPMDVQEWKEKMEQALFLEEREIAFDQYSLENATKQYLNLFDGILNCY